MENMFQGLPDSIAAQVQGLQQMLHLHRPGLPQDPNVRAQNAVARMDIGATPPPGLPPPSQLLQSLPTETSRQRARRREEQRRRPQMLTTRPTILTSAMEIGREVELRGAMPPNEMYQPYPYILYGGPDPAAAR